MEVKSHLNAALQPHAWVNGWMEEVHLAFPAAGPVGEQVPPNLPFSVPGPGNTRINCLAGSVDLTLLKPKEHCQAGGIQGLSL